MTVLTESVYPGEFLLGKDATEFISRDGPVTITGGSYVAGQVLGRILGSAISAWTTGHAYSLGAVVQPVTANRHFYRCTTAGTSSADTEPTWPTNGTTIADGAGALVWTDAGLLGRYKKHDPAAADGSQTAAAILFDSVDASVADQLGVIVDRLAEVNGDLLTWIPNISAPNKAAGIAALLTLNIIVR